MTRIKKQNNSCVIGCDWNNQTYFLWKKCFGIEAGVVNGWEKYINENCFIGMTTFGASGPYKEVYKHFGITADNIFEKIKQKLSS